MTPTHTSPWVYIFSKFTSEALLFEALIIFSLCAVYTGFWLLRKRKFGVIHKEVPAGVVKYYLNELIVDAEQLRAQLFGLLSGQGVAPTPIPGLVSGNSAQVAAQPAPVSIVAGDPQSAQTLAALEAKLAEQAKQIENFVAEKAKVEQELAAAKASPSTAAGAGADDSKLKEKISQLEAKLAEYSVIEDDLANLKRLQQENASLKAQLGGKAPAPTPNIAAAPAAPAAEPSTQGKPPIPTIAEAGVAAAPTAAPADASKAVADASAPAATSGAAAAPAAAALKESIAAAETGKLGEGGFDHLVDQVEQSLQSPAAQQPAPAAAAGGVSSTTDAPAATIEKSDADLVAEFEKMLNG